MIAIGPHIRQMVSCPNDIIMIAFQWKCEKDDWEFRNETLDFYFIIFAEVHKFIQISIIIEMFI